MAKSIDVSDVNIYYGDFKAVEGVNMTIKAKAVTAFIGPSGCGKSTFLRSINRMHEVLPGARVEGRLTIDSQNIYGRDVEVRFLRYLRAEQKFESLAALREQIARDVTAAQQAFAQSAA